MASALAIRVREHLVLCSESSPIRLDAPYFSHLVVQRLGLTIGLTNCILQQISIRGQNG